MRLFRLEVKRIMKSHRTLVLLAIAILMSVVMAYLPISFESINICIVYCIDNASFNCSKV